MKVLNFFMHSLFPTAAGNQSNTLELCKVLKKKKYYSTLMYVDYNDTKKNKIIKKKTRLPFNSIYSVPYNQGSLYRSLKRKLNNQTRVFLGKSPITNHFNLDNRIKASLGDFFKNNFFDVVIIHYIFATKLIIPLLDKNTKVLLFSHGLLHLEQYRFYSFMPQWWHERNKLEEYKIFEQYEKILVVGDYEKEILVKDKFDRKKIMLCGVASEPMKAIKKNKRNIDILFVSGSGKHNVDGLKLFIKNIYPKIINTYPLIKICFAGSICKNAFLKNKKNIKLYGYVNQNKLDRLYSSSKLVINPVFNGVGVKVKTVEALSHSSIVLTTNNGKEGISNLPNNLLFSGDTDTFWISTIRKIIEEKIDTHNYRKNVFKWSKKNLSGEKVYSEAIKWINSLK